MIEPTIVFFELNPYFNHDKIKEKIVALCYLLLAVKLMKILFEKARACFFEVNYFTREYESLFFLGQSFHRGLRRIWVV